MNTVIWIKDLHACTESLNKCFEAANRQGDKMKHYDEDRFIQLIHRKEYINGDEFISGIENYKLIFIIRNQIKAYQQYHYQFTVRHNPVLIKISIY